MPFSISLRLFNKTIPKLQYAENAAESVEIHDLEVLKSQNIIRPKQVEAKSQISKLVKLISKSYLYALFFIHFALPSITRLSKVGSAALL